MFIRVAVFLQRVNRVEVGDKVRWIGDWVGGRVTGVLIARGEIREVVSVGCGRLWLSGRDGRGVFGSCDPKNVEVVGVCTHN